MLRNDSFVLTNVIIHKSIGCIAIGVDEISNSDSIVPTDNSIALNLKVISNSGYINEIGKNIGIKSRKSINTTDLLDETIGSKQNAAVTSVKHPQTSQIDLEKSTSSSSKLRPMTPRMTHLICYHLSTVSDYFQRLPLVT